MGATRIYQLLSGNIPGGLAALPVAVGLFSYIWYQVYKHSGLITIRVLKTGFAVIAGFCLFNYGLLWLFLQPPADLVRVLVMPLENKGAAEDGWLGRAISHSIEYRLLGAGDKKKVIFQHDWMDRMSRFKILEGADTVRADLYRLLGIRYLVSGEYKRSGDRIGLSLQYRDLKERKLLLNLERKVSPKLLFEFTGLAAGQAHKLFRIRSQRDQPRDDITNSFAAYKDYHRGWNALRQGQPAAAEGHLKQALAADSALAQVYIRRCELVREKALAEKDENKRKRLLERSVRQGVQALRLDNTLAEAYIHLAWTHIYLERFAEAENELKLANHHQPLDARVFYLLSKLDEDRFAVFGFEREAEVLEHAVKINPGFVRGLEYLIDLYLNLYRREEARVLVERLIEVNPTDLNAYIKKSFVYIYFNDWDNVIATCHEVLNKDSLNVDAYYNIGIAYKAQTMYDSAIVYFKKAVSLGLVDAYNYLAAIHEARKEYYAAIKYLRLRVKKGEGEEDRFQEEARRSLYRLVHKPGIVVDTNFAFQRQEKDPARDSVQVLYEN